MPHPEQPSVRLLAMTRFLLAFSLQAADARAESCRHLGVVEIKVGSEHCGYIDPEHKRAIQATACTLAESREEELKMEARSDDSTCKSTDCRGSLRPWQNIYTHVFSQNCWSECGWAWVLDCEHGPAAENGEQEAQEEPRDPAEENRGESSVGSDADSNMTVRTSSG